jgi:Rps23 Pro-64 3,4-dihydroxylase Tpa1-like proline 4-hydroxylase
MTELSQAAFAPQVRDRASWPFCYLLLERCFPDTIVECLIAWLERDAPWRLVETDFYEQYEFSLLDAELPVPLAHLVEPASLDTVRCFIEEQFGSRLTERVDLVAHKLLPGQRIAIHNDYLVGEETHRLTVQLNRGLSDEDGGFFMLFNSFDAADVHRVLRPVCNTAIAFEISMESHHAVSRQHGGERYTLVYSFHARRADT